MNNAYTAQITLNRIEELRVKRRVSVSQMLRECGLSKSIIDNLKKGSMFSADKAAILADYLDCSIDYLLGRTDDSTSSTGIQQNITAGDNNNGSNNISITPAVEAGQEIDSILSSLKPRERTELMMMIYHFADEHTA